MSASNGRPASAAFVLVGLVGLLAWQGAILAGASRRVEVLLGLYGFVLHVLFGKSYALVPSYFARQLRPVRAPLVHLPLSVAGVALLVLAAAGVGPDWTGVVGALAWTAGVAVFLATLAWTLRSNPLGRETGTGDAAAHRRRVDRYANAFVPVALGYLGAGALAVLAPRLGVVDGIWGYPPRATHLLAAGGAFLALLAIGARLLPRLLVADPPRRVVAVALPAGALGPAFLAAGLPAGPLLHAGAALEGVALLGYAALVGRLLGATDRTRVGHGALAGGALAAVGLAALGVHLAVSGPRPGVVLAHARLALFGVLGLSIVGVAFHFYPPNVGTAPLSGDRLGRATLGALGVAVGLLVAAPLLGSRPVEAAGALAGLAGALSLTHLVAGVLARLPG